jgi:hypothetical protein
MIAGLRQKNSSGTLALDALRLHPWEIVRHSGV